MSSSVFVELREKLNILLKNDTEGVTQGKISAISGVSVSTISRICAKNTKNPQLRTLTKLNKAVNEILIQKKSGLTKSRLLDKDLSILLDNLMDSNSEKEFVCLTDLEKSVICRDSVTTSVYDFIATCLKIDIYEADIKEEYGNRGIHSLNYLLENRMISINEKGKLIPKYYYITIDDPIYLVKQVEGALSNFDISLLGKCGALSKLSGSISADGLLAIRKIVYKAIEEINLTAKFNPGKIPYFTCMFSNAYSAKIYYSKLGYNLEFKEDHLQ